MHKNKKGLWTVNWNIFNEVSSNDGMQYLNVRFCYLPLSLRKQILEPKNLPGFYKLDKVILLFSYVP